MEHVYSEEEAQRIIDAFPADKLAELIAVATKAQRDPATTCTHTPVVLPQGWAYQVFANCIIVAYKDGDQERKKYFVPRIWIEFKRVEKIEARKSVEERLALGYCSCGKRMPFAQALLWVGDMIERKGFWSLPSKAIGYSVGIPLGLYLMVSGKQQLSLQFNRHWSCL